MKKYKRLEQISDIKFRRLTGIKRNTFSVIVEILKAASKIREKRGGPKRKLCEEDCLLLCLEYLREYRTYFHIGFDYGISESQAQRIQKWVEKEIILDNRFHLPNRKELLENKGDCERVLVEATESPLARPKKTKNNAILERKNDILKRFN
jgi:hypothetical protein